MSGPTRVENPGSKMTDFPAAYRPITCTTPCSTSTSVTLWEFTSTSNCVPRTATIAVGVPSWKDGVPLNRLVTTARSVPSMNSNNVAPVGTDSCFKASLESDFRRISLPSSRRRRILEPASVLTSVPSGRAPFLTTAMLPPSGPCACTLPLRSKMIAPPRGAFPTVDDPVCSVAPESEHITTSAQSVFSIYRFILSSHLQAI